MWREAVDSVLCCQINTVDLCICFNLNKVLFISLTYYEVTIYILT